MERSLLTYDQVAGWRRRLEQIAREEQALADEKRNIERKLEAVAVLIEEVEIEMPVEAAPPQAVEAKPEASTKSSRSRPTWPKEIMRIFTECRRPLTNQALRDLIEEGPLRGEYEKSEKGFYHAISRLQKKGDLQKHRGWLFLENDLREHLRKVNAGEIDDVEEVPTYAHRRSPMGEEIKDYLKDHPEGVTSKDVIAYLKKDSRFVDTLTKNSTGAYNVISRLAKRGEIRKEGTTIYPLKENEPPKGGSETGEAATSSSRVERGEREDTPDIFS